MRAAGLIAIAALAACKYDRPEPFEPGQPDAAVDAPPGDTISVSLTVRGLWDGAEPLELTITQGDDVATQTFNGDVISGLLELAPGVPTQLDIDTPALHTCEVVGGPTLTPAAGDHVEIECEGPGHLFVDTPQHFQIPVREGNTSLSVLVKSATLSADVTATFDGAPAPAGGFPIVFGVEVLVRLESVSLFTEKLMTFAATGAPQPVITLPVGDAGARGGIAIDISEGVGPIPDRMIVGGTDAAHVFELVNGEWMLTQSLTGALADVGFGRSVAISGNTVFIGAPMQNTINGMRSGAVHVYRYNGTEWLPGQAPMEGGSADARFGYSIAMDGARAVIGAPNVQGAGIGYATLVTNTGNLVRQTISNDGLYVDADDSFGESVAIRGQTILVSAPYDDRPGLGTDNVPALDPGGGPMDRGSVYQFNLATRTKFIQPPFEGPLALAHFGQAVAFAGTALVIGAPNQFDLEASAGGAFAYLDADPQVLPTNGAMGEARVGWSVDGMTNLAVIGSLLGNRADVWTFDTSGDMPVVTNVATLRGDSRSFGTSVGVIPGTLVVGEPDVSPNEAGRITIYR